MEKNCDTCAYQTSRWKVCTNKRKKAKVNQELLKEKGYCHDYIEKEILFSNIKVIRYMYDRFASKNIEQGKNEIKKDEIRAKEQAKVKKEEWSIKDVEKFFESLEKCLSAIWGGK
jgi:hypothetical protein